MNRLIITFDAKRGTQLTQDEPILAGEPYPATFINETVIILKISGSANCPCFNLSATNLNYRKRTYYSEYLVPKVRVLSDKSYFGNIWYSKFSARCFSSINSAVRSLTLCSRSVLPSHQEQNTFVVPARFGVTVPPPSSVYTSNTVSVYSDFQWVTIWLITHASRSYPVRQTVLQAVWLD